jgi:ESF2/ABP1 family protein
VGKYEFDNFKLLIRSGAKFDQTSPKKKNCTSMSDQDQDDRFQMEEDQDFASSQGSGSEGEEQEFDAGSGSDNDLEDDISDNQEDMITPQDMAKEHQASLSAKPLTSEKLAKFQSKLDATGVVYLSRVPPFMKPTKLRSLLSKYGKLGRIYLAPEDAKITARRKKYRHNKRQNYTEGWVEFLDKKVARSTSALLNNTNIGGKKRSYYYDDIWNLKYLPRFKWNHLTEQIAYELKVREQKLKTELSQQKRETKLYVKNVEKAKMIEAMKEKRAAKKAKLDELESSSVPKKKSPSSGATKESIAEIKRRFKQRKVVNLDGNANEQTKKPIQSKTVSIFSKLFSS